MVIRITILIFLCSLSSIALSKNALEKFNSSTGELYWDISPEYRLSYIPNCGINKLKSYDTGSELHEAMRNMDVFGILRNTNESVMLCDGRGIRILYRLREDNIPPYDHINRVFINNKIISAPLIVEKYKTKLDIEDYQQIYSAIQTGKSITVQIKTKINSYDFTYGDMKGKLLSSHIINIDNMSKADDIHKRRAQASIKNINSKLSMKYIYILIYDLLIIIGLILIFLVYKSKIHPVLKGVLLTTKEKIYKQYHSVVNRKTSDVNIVKSDNLKAYSVADELLKWAKLKEDGLVTEQQFEEARQKLLNRN